MDGTTVEKKALPYELVGGADGVRRLANAFYDAMDRNPDYAALRKMHEPDLGPMREALAGYLSAWLGGPHDWIEKRGGFCIMSRHAAMDITDKTAGQWMDAMREAMRDVGIEPELAKTIDQALSRMADAMSGRGRAGQQKV
jgi:hemoglobin